MGDHPQAPQTIVNVNMANYAPGAAVQDWIPNKRTIAVRGAYGHRSIRRPGIRQK